MVLLQDTGFEVRRFLRERIASRPANLKANIIVPGAGHFVAEERPAELIAVLMPFLAD